MKPLRIVAGLAALLVGVLACLLLFLFIALPDAGEPLPIKADPTPERLARGAYLANHVMACTVCHSERDRSYYTGPVVAGTEGMGGELFSRDMGLPGMIYAPNITPAALGDWTDGEIARAIVAGVSRDGRPYFPLMPYESYRRLSEEDLLALVTYLRSLAPIDHEVPETELDFPLNLIVRTIPQPYSPQPAPDRSDPVAYGEYLLTIGVCAACHTPADKQGTPLPGMHLAGGYELVLPNGTRVRSANITPDKATGIGTWSEQTFVERFKTYAGPEAHRLPVPDGQGNTDMPWTAYAGMEEEDLKAIYAYLRTVKPVANEVERFPDL